MLKIKRALISVSDKTGIIEFAKELQKFNVEIISTGGTYQILKSAGLKILNISEVTGFPEILDGRVKTLHPAIHAGLLARRDLPEHLETIKKHHINQIDMVVVNLYPFEATISKDNVSLEEVLENIDIGGPSMIRSGSKNFRSVAVIVKPERYPEIIEELKKNNGSLSEETCLKLAQEAFEHTSYYDSVIASYFANLQKIDLKLPEKINILLKKNMSLRYGENPHQQGAFYTAFNNKTYWQKLQGKELSFNNIMDMDSAFNLLIEFEKPAVVIIKHSSPCGVAESDEIMESYEKALKSDPISAFGGIVALNRPVEEKLARKITEIFLEVIIAPDFSENALEILGSKQNLRLIKWPFIESNKNSLENLDFKKVSAGFLIQEKDTKIENELDLKTVTSKKPTPDQIKDLIFAWKVVKHTKSNAIVVAKNSATLGIGTGQTSRIRAVEHALSQAGEKAQSAVLASDAFFPFPDSVELSAKAGISAIIQPGGSVKDAEVISAAEKSGIAMVFTGTRHFKH